MHRAAQGMPYAPALLLKDSRHDTVSLIGGQAKLKTSPVASSTRTGTAQTLAGQMPAITYGAVLPVAHLGQPASADARGFQAGRIRYCSTTLATNGISSEVSTAARTSTPTT
jgi:hypothetical protein